ncbi:AMP-binding protein [Streptomyces sp. NPDC058155]|uniref:AMP-binding protein n=1 Tax=Streptomyces sp. NPDC058155 TaxID=3346359 RepID=UPI0036ED2257
MPRRGRLVHSLLDEAVAETPDAYAVRDTVVRWTFSQLSEMSHGVARRLAAEGVGPGDRVVVRAETTVEQVALFYGVSRLGAVFVPLSPTMKAFQLKSVLANAEPRLVIADNEETGRLTDVPTRLMSDLWPEVEKAVASEIHDGTDVTAGVRPRLDDIATLIYTSGSTAMPKAVICPHEQATFAAEAIQAELGYRPDDVVLCRFPLCWDYGLYKVLLCCLGRSELVLAGRDSDLTLMARMRETGATIVPVVPSLATMIAKLAGRDEGPPPPVRMFTNTGAALPRSTTDELRAAFPGVRVVRQFGQTECKRVSVMPPEEDLERPDSVGRPLPGTQVLILDEAGRSVPTGESGEIVVTGPHVMPGYWRAPEQTERAFRRDEATGTPRLHTGDYGRLDEDGYLYFEGRRDDMFKRRGTRMSTVEIEAAAMDIAGVRAAAALPPAGGHDLALFVESELPPQKVLRELAARLQPEKVPAVCRVIAELPLTANGKNARKVLAELLDGSAE